MLADVNIVAGCTARKAMPTVPSLELRSIAPADPALRVQRWITRLQTSSEPKVSATDLYTGDAWQIIKPFGKTHQLWIASAGYGLVNQQTRLCSYSATFAKRHPDSVLDGERPDRATRQSSVWWNELVKWQKYNQAKSSIADLARSHPHSSIVVVLSPEYLNAIQEDVCAARNALTDPMRLVIISAGARKTGPLAENFLPCDARLQTQLGGARASLNARIARKVLAETTSRKMHMVELREKFDRLLSTSLDIVKLKRSPMNDREVTNFIIEQLCADPNASHSRLLHILRNERHACEQSRFKRLFQKARKSFS